MEHDILAKIVEQGLAAESKEVAAKLTGLLQTLCAGGDSVAAERSFRECILSLGGRLIGRALTHADQDLRHAVRERGHRDPSGQPCDGRIKGKGAKETVLLSLLGDVCVRRWTGICRSCNRWIGSVEELFDAVDGVTASCASAVTAAAVCLPYKQAEHQLRLLAGIEIDDNRIHRVVAATAPRVAQFEQLAPEVFFETVGAPPPGTWVYVMIDGGRIRFRGGAWREPCTALVLWRKDDGTWQKIGFSDPTTKSTVTRELDRWLEALRRRGRRKVAIIADGAEWIWNWARAHPWTVRILDYYHLKEHVHDAARTYCGEGTAASDAWAKKVMNRLWRGWVPTTVDLLREVSPTGRGAQAAKQALTSLATYLANHKGLIRYSRHRSKDCAIGSGAIESFCKQLFSMRMKGPGMFWSEEGAGHLMRLRTIYLTGRWSELWRPADTRVAKAA